MNTDCYFEIGSSHQICQDYAYSGQEFNFSYAVISDGCSASGKHGPVDFGARLIVHSYINQIIESKNGIFLDKEEGVFTEENSVGNIYFRNALKNIAKLSLSRCGQSIRMLNLSEATLDCTLLSIVSDGKNTFYSIFGDGLIIFYTNKNIYVIEVDFPSSAPFYLSYGENKIREEAYFREFDLSKNYKRTKYNHNWEVVEFVEKSIDCSEVLAGKFYLRDDEYLIFAAVTSDGYMTYFDEREREYMDCPSVLKEMFGYKNFNGEFVKRRMLSFKRSCASRGIFHLDDVSIATINFGELNE
jgi:hypothetical protein